MSKWRSPIVRAIRERLEKEWFESDAGKATFGDKAEQKAKSLERENEK
jgi:hypothetical protein